MRANARSPTGTVSCASCGWSDQTDSMCSSDRANHGQPFHRQNRAVAARVKPTCLAFRHYWPDISPREVGGGRATRQPGQVRKEAALTSAVRVARQPPTYSRNERESANAECEPALKAEDDGRAIENR